MLSIHNLYRQQKSSILVSIACTKNTDSKFINFWLNHEQKKNSRWKLINDLYFIVSGNKMFGNFCFISNCIKNLNSQKCRRFFFALFFVVKEFCNVVDFDFSQSKIHKRITHETKRLQIKTRCARNKKRPKDEAKQSKEYQR